MSRTVLAALDMNDTLEQDVLVVTRAKYINLKVKDQCCLRAAVFSATEEMQGFLRSNQGAADAERQELKCFVCASGIFGLRFRNDQGCTLFIKRPLESCTADTNAHPLVGRCGHNTCIAALLKHQKQVLTGTLTWSKAGAVEINIDYNLLQTPMNKILMVVEAASTPEGLNKFRVQTKKLTELVADCPAEGDVSLHQLGSS
jgi:hypothetical protein